MPHQVLSLEIPSVTNACIIRIVDTGSYDLNIPISCLTLQVTAPGFTDPSNITTLIPNYSANFTACDLGLQTTNCDNYHNNLSDGVYIIKQSVSPNDKVFVEYNHLRITLALNKYQSLLCCIQSTIPSTPSKEVRERIRQAQEIKTYFEAAKAEVEYCHNPKSGIATYSYAMDLLNKMLCSCSCPDSDC